jgi:DNA mismatch repair protein MutL
MGIIQVLPSLIAERIAAGEVIERPSSAVKELCENALDAGATAIEVRLQKGGTDLIEIIDNGSGMARNDLEVCIARHATSKIRSFEDLTRLSTLGFRGEALPSIASVSDLSITSRHRNSTETYEIKLAQSAASRVSSEQTANLNFLGANHGTRIRVASLFSQVPARLKFLKSPGAEASAVREILERLALTHPEVGFTLKSDERTLLNLPAENLRDRAVRLLSDENPYEVKEVELPGQYSIQVIWLKGLSFPHTRGLYQIVNGRALRDRTLQTAILNPLKQSFLPGNFPACVVKIDLPSEELDVNVHPSKTEIRFLDSRKIFTLCDAAFNQLLGTDRFARAPEGGWSHSQTAYSSAGFNFNPGHTPILSLGNPVSMPEGSSSGPEMNFTDSTPIGDYRGVLFSTYFVFEKDDQLTLIDQHAAHERIRYERLKNSILKQETPEIQELLVPEILKSPLEKILALRDKLTLLEKMGFQVEVFGEDSILFRSIPAVWGNRGLPERLKNLLERLLDAEVDPGHLAWDETLFEKIAMEACRSSFKAGDYVTDFSAIDLTRKLYSCEHPGNCPHGRPTSIRISKHKVEEWFSRLS